jgi:hypothetical protein
MLIRNKILLFTIILFASVSINGRNSGSFTTETFSLIDNITQPVTSYFYIDQSLGKFVPISENYQQMNFFYNALKNIKKRSVRIAHYGDSLILGDIITGDLRDKLQQKYGGQGVGFLNIVSDDFRMRTTTIHSYSEDWEYISFLTRNPKQVPFGIAGAVAIPKPGSWVKYEAGSVNKSCSAFNLIKVYYNSADPSSTIQYSIDDAGMNKVFLEPGDDVKELVIKAKGNSKKFYLQFLNGRIPNFFGVSLENSNGGIYVDNFPMRGNSGASLADISENLLQGFNKNLHYDLIIMSYGANVSTPNRVFTVYENKMLHVIEQFKRAFPQTSFLLISTTDRTQKVGSKFITNPDFLALLETQKRIAQKSGIAFWNLSETMGGLNSMDAWVNSNPPLALKDYAHFTPRGGQKVAGFLFDSLIDLSSKF